jgi:hypothetical protein
MSYEQVFRFGSADWVLFGNALNEVLHGFNVPDFDEVIGSDWATIEKLLRRLHAMHNADELTLGMREMFAVRNAVRETIRELGVEEFHTRTGYDFEQGNAILVKLDSLLRRVSE